MTTLSIVAAVQEYVQAMMDRVQGMKVMILDHETVGIISMVFSQSDILQHEVFLVERIDVEQIEKMRHMNAICFLRPTSANFLTLTKILKTPNYNEYHVFFTNVVPHMRLEQLACCDEHEVVHQVQEFFADVYAINHDLFSLNLPSTIRLTENTWTSYEESVFDRTVEGILAACINLRMLPAIRYTASSELTRQIAQRLDQRFREEKSLFDSVDRGKKGEATPQLLLLDRRNDPVTPLLNQWTYQAMLHELLTLVNNRIDMSKVPGIRKEHEEIVMSTTQDQFFEENVVANFGDLGMNIKVLTEQYQAQTSNTAKIESIEDMQRFVDEYPEFRKMSGNVSKHVAVVHELSRVIEANSLLQVSQLEQELACSENRQEHQRRLTELIRGDDIPNMERLRLVLLFALRYENDSLIPLLKDGLRQKGICEDQVRLVDDLINYAGSHVRSGDLFGNKNFFSQAKKTLTSSFKGVENVYTQHKTMLSTIAEKLMKGTLKEANYPFFEGKGSNASPSKEQLPRAMIFVVGGACYEEARDVLELNKSLGSRCVTLGGTTMHNSRSFLAEVAQVGARSDW
jgi:vacuolar protein sorting-associated protein 45